MVLTHKKDFFEKKTLLNLPDFYKMVPAGMENETPDFYNRFQQE
jgi:hypothetical protein